MAYLGAIGTLCDRATPSRRIAVWIGSAGQYPTQTFLSESGKGTISGVVKVVGAPAAGIFVYLLYRGDESLGRLNMSVIERATSAADGSFSFNGLNTSKNCYAVVAVDPAGGETYNLAVHDRLTPV